MDELSYNTISTVIDSWEKLRQLKDYEEVAGRGLFIKLFKKCPKAKVLFGFPIDTDTDCPELVKSKRFIMHSSYLIQMLDTALNMLGPDFELLVEIMVELGDKHRRFGVQAEMFPVMKDSLILTLREKLSDSDFTEATEAAWNQTFDGLSSIMIRSMKK